MKKWLKTTLASVGLIGSTMFALTGCGVQTDIKNDSSDILYNGGIVSVVGDHLVFANGYKSDDISTISNYNDFAKVSYLAAVNSENIANDKFVSPEGVKKLNSKVLGYKNEYMFVYGNSIYYATPNLHKTGSNQHVFTYVSFFKCNFDGSGETELLTTQSYDSEKAVIRALKFDGKAYLFVFDGTDLYVINLQNNTKKCISSKATSVAIPSEGDEWNGKVFYTESKENSNGQKGNQVFSYDVKEGKSKSLNNNINETVTFTGRIRDRVFYTHKDEITSVTTTKVADSNRYSQVAFASAGVDYYDSEISNIISITGNDDDDYNTVIFTSSLTGSSQVMIEKPNSDKCVLLENDKYSDVIFAHNGLIYYSTDSGICCKDVDTNETTTLVEDMEIISGKVGYNIDEDGCVTHLYFYAKLVYPEDDETEEDDKDTNYYLYQVETTGYKNVSLVGKKI